MEFSRARWGVAALALLTLTLTLALTPPPARGQERTSPAESAAAAAVDSPAQESSSSLSWLIHSPLAVRLVTLIIAAMSFYLVALVIWMALRYRAAVAMPRGLSRELQELLEQRRYSEAYHRLAADDSMLARVLSVGVRKLPAGLPVAQRALELANEDATMEMEHRTTYLATVGTLGPMIGLVGTVYGMIVAFRVIASEGSAPQASQLAAGISIALIATLEGIAISIPAIYFYSMFRNRIARLSLEVAMAAEPLLEQFVPGVRSQEASQPPPPPRAAATVPVPVPMPMPMPMGGARAHPHPYAASTLLNCSK